MRPATLLLMATLSTQAAVPDLAELNRMAARFTKVEMKADVSGLSSGDKEALASLIAAGDIINRIFMKQLWSGNLAEYDKLREDASALGRARLHYYWLNKGPWSDLDGHTAFVPGVPDRKPPGANFYPEDMSRAEFESWLKTLSPDQREAAESFFTVIRRDPATKKLAIVPYSYEYRDDLQQAAKLLRDAAAATTNASLKKFLQLRADAFLSNEYFASDIAWMDLDAPLDITIGPYETYNDELFGYKAAFEAYINLRDDKETEKLKFFGDHLQEVENHLPIDAKYRNPKLGAAAPIRVVNEILAAGDGAHAVQTAAYNLPNDDRVIQQKGSKRVMLKNVQEAKFNAILKPIASRVLSRSAQADLSFDSFFTHILAHELSHGIGPHQISIGGRATTVRQQMKELYSAIEEAKADVTGLFMLQYLFDQGLLPRAERPLYTTFLASAFRTLRFGTKEAHGKGMALQFNYLMDKGAFVQERDGSFSVDFAKIKSAVRDLAHDLLTVEAAGDYTGAKKMLDALGSLRPPMQRALESLKDIPTDIEPVFTTAEELRK
jgi:hypothetical protein